MKIPKSTQPRGTRVQPGKSRDVDNLEERWLRRWKAWLIANTEGLESFYAVAPQCCRQFCLPGDDHPFDFAFPFGGRDENYPPITIEIQGGQKMDKSGHTNWNGQNRDALKTRLAAERGFRVMTWTTDDIAKDRGFDQLGRALGIISGNDPIR